jgi:archaemetzincin
VKSKLTHARPVISEQSHIDIVPFGVVDKLAVSVVAANLQTIMGLNAATLRPHPDPEFAYLTLRSQYAAGEIIKELAIVEHGSRFKLGIVECDLCTPILKFVFGESQLGGKAAVISLHRLKGEKPARTYERVAKIGLHETGHLLGIGHCRTHDCLMVFAATIEKLDALPLRFCDACRYEISRSLKNIFGPA